MAIAKAQEQKLKLLSICQTSVCHLCHQVTWLGPATETTIIWHDQGYVYREERRIGPLMQLIFITLHSCHTGFCVPVGEWDFRHRAVFGTGVETALDLQYWVCPSARSRGWRASCARRRRLDFILSVTGGWCNKSRTSKGKSKSDIWCAFGWIEAGGKETSVYWII